MKCLGKYILNFWGNQGDKWTTGSWVCPNTNVWFTFEMGHSPGGAKNKISGINFQNWSFWSLQPVPRHLSECLTIWTFISVIYKSWMLFPCLDYVTGERLDVNSTGHEGEIRYFFFVPWNCQRVSLIRFPSLAIDPPDKVQRRSRGCDDGTAAIKDPNDRQWSGIYPVDYCTPAAPADGAALRYSVVLPSYCCHNAKLR